MSYTLNLRMCKGRHEVVESNQKDPTSKTREVEMEDNVFYLPLVRKGQHDEATSIEGNVICRG